MVVIFLSSDAQTTETGATSMARWKDIKHIVGAVKGLVLDTTDSKSIVLFYRCDRIFNLPRDSQTWYYGTTLYVEKDFWPRVSIWTVFVSREVENLFLHTKLYRNIKVENLFEGQKSCHIGRIKQLIRNLYYQSQTHSPYTHIGMPGRV